MGVVESLHQPDSVVTAADLKTVALELLSEIPIPEVEAAAFDSGDGNLREEFKRYGFKISSRNNTVWLV